MLKDETGGKNLPVSIVKSERGNTNMIYTGNNHRNIYYMREAGAMQQIPTKRGALSEAQELNMRKLLAEYPAGVVEMQDGSLFPVRTCSKDMKNTCHVTVPSDKGDELRVFLLDKDSTTWRFNFQNMGSNVEFLGKQIVSSPTCFEDGTDASPALQAFTFRVTKKEYGAKPSVFEKIEAPTNDNESERVVGRTNVKVMSQIPQLRV